MTQTKVRIAFVVSRLGVGGAERQLVSLVNGLDRDRFTPVVVCLKDAGPLRSELSADIDVASLNVEDGANARSVGLAAALLRDRRSELVHCTNFNATFWGRAAARRVGIPVVIAEHATRRSSLRESVLVRLGNALFGQTTRKVIACTEAQIDVLVREGCDRAAIQVIRNGVDVAAFAAATPAVDIVNGEKRGIVVLVAAGLSSVKNHDLLVRSAASLVREGVPVHLVFAGDGPMRPFIESLVTRLRMQEWVTLLGIRSDMPRLMAAADVVALPSYSEAFPMCLLEAMAAGRAVVATAVGGVPELVENGTSGILVPSQDEPALTAALELLASDAQLRARMGVEGQRLARERFSSHAMVSAYESLFQSILDGDVVR